MPNVIAGLELRRKGLTARPLVWPGAASVTEAARSEAMEMAMKAACCIVVVTLSFSTQLRPCHLCGLFHFVGKAM